MLKTARHYVAAASSALAFLLLFALSVRAEEITWQSDFEAAKAKAKAENKQIFTFFTGSDWCTWCKRLQAEVFEKEVFQKEMPKRFVFLELDYPHEKKLPDEIVAQNKKMAEQFKIIGYPTVLLLDAEGNEIAQTGYKAGGPDEYLKHLDDFQTAYEKLVQLKSEAAKAAGLEKAKLLDGIVDAYGKLNNKSDAVIDVSKEIVKLDSDNKGGLKNKHTYLVLIAEAKGLQKAEKLGEAVAVVDKALALPDLTDKQKANALKTKAVILVAKKDYAGVVACLEKVLEIDPENSENVVIKMTLKQYTTILDAQKKVENLQAEADKATGMDRAKLLVQLLEAKESLAGTTSTMINAKEKEKIVLEIASLDPENTLGLKTTIDVIKGLAAGQKMLQTRKPEEAKAIYEQVLTSPDLTDAQKQEAHYSLAVCYMMQKEMPKGLELLKTALQDAPSGPRATFLEKVIPAMEKQINEKKAEDGSKKETAVSEGK